MRLVCLSLLAANLVTGAASAALPIRGRVLADGQPLAGARIELSRDLTAAAEAALVVAGRSRAEPVDAAASGASGWFELVAPEPGPWKVRVTAPGRVAMQHRLRPLLEGLVLAPVELAAAGAVRVEVGTPEGEPAAGAQVWADGWRGAPLWRQAAATGWHPAGRFAFTDERGVATLARAAGEPLRAHAFHAAHGAAPPRPVQAGVVRLTLPAARQLLLELRHPDGRPAEGWVVQLGEGRWSAARTGEDGRARVALAADEPTPFAVLSPQGRLESGELAATAAELAGSARGEPVVVALPPARRLRGRVVDAETGRPVAGAWVWPRWDPSAARRSDASGGFELVASRQRPALLHAAAAGYLRSDPRRLEPGDPADGLRMALEPAGEIAGRIVDGGGEPVAGAAVRLLRSGRRPGPRVRLATSDPEGRFRLAPLPLGGASPLLVTAEGLAPRRVTAAVAPPGSGRLLEVILGPGRAVSGRVVAEDGPVVPGAEVTLLAYLDRGAAGVGEVSAERPPALSDAEGRFAVRGLADGEYSAAVRAVGFAPRLVRRVEVAGEDVELGEIALRRGVSLEGRVVDGDGAPLAGVAVTAANEALLARWLPARWPGADGGPAVTTAVTDAAGRFAIGELSEGDYLGLDVRHEGFAPRRLHGVEPGSPLEIVLERGVTVRGRVTDATGEAVARARVSPAAGGRGRQPGLPPPEGSATTDADGRFELAGLGAGRLELEVRARGYLAATRRGRLVDPGEAVEGFDFVLERGAAVRVRVLAEASGRPVPSAEVFLHEPRPGELPHAGRGPVAFGRTDGAGLVSLDGFPAGEGELEVRHPRFVPVRRPVAVDDGAELEVRLASGYEVSGRVVGESGSPVAGARVSLYGPARPGMAAAHTDGEGRFRFEGVASGEYRLEAWSAEHAAPPAVEVAVEERSVSDLEVRLDGGSDLLGRIGGLEPAELGRVRLEAYSRAGQQAPGRVGADGTFRIERVSPGRWHVSARLDDGREATGEVELGPGGEAPWLELEFGSGVTIEGIVRLDGEPLRGASVVFFAAGGEGSSQSRTDARGRFRLADLEPGPGLIRVFQVPGGVSARRRIEVVGDDEVDFDLVSGRISGVVRAVASGEPLARATVDLRGPAGTVEAGRWRAAVASDRAGAFEFGPVQPGSYRVRARRSGYVQAEREVEVVEGDALEGVELALDSAVRLSVRVVREDGVAPAELSYALLDDAGALLAAGSRRLERSGELELDDLPAGGGRLLIAGDGTTVAALPVTVPGPPVAATLGRGAPLYVTVEPLLGDLASGWAELFDTAGQPFLLPAGGGLRRRFPLEMGRVWVPGLTPGPWRVEITTEDGRRWAVGVVTVAGETTEATLR